MNDTDIIRRVINLSEVEVFECQGELFSSEPYPETVFARNPVAVYSTNGTRVGFAALDLDTLRLHTKVFLVKDCPERLDIENKEPICLTIRDSFYFGGLIVLSIQLQSAAGTSFPLVTRGPL